MGDKKTCDHEENEYDKEHDTNAYLSRPLGQTERDASQSHIKYLFVSPNIINADGADGPLEPRKKPKLEKDSKANPSIEVLGKEESGKSSKSSIDIKDGSWGSTSKTSQVDCLVHTFLSSSNIFLNRAHSLVLQANSKKGLRIYFKLVKLAVQSLLILIKRYGKCLNPELELYVYLKLSKIYFNETENIDRADEYVNRAIVIASRNNLPQIKLACELLACQILIKTDPKLSINYINAKVSFYDTEGLKSQANLFLLLKVSALSVFDSDSAMMALYSLSKEMSIEVNMKATSLLYQSMLCLYRGAPSDALRMCDEVDKLVTPLSIFPVQLTAMGHLIRYASFILSNKISDATTYMRRINNFILGEQKNAWKDWNEDGSIRIALNLVQSDAFENQYEYDLSWLNSDEFVILFYFFMGIHLMLDSRSTKKAHRVFKKCLDILSGQLNELNGIKSKRNYSLHKLRNSKLRLYYVKYNIQYYQLWLKFLSNEFTDLEPLDEFINSYASFGDEELCYFDSIIPKLLYLRGIYSQYSGNLAAAKYYYMQVCHLTSSNRTNRYRFEKDMDLNKLPFEFTTRIFEPTLQHNELNIYACVQLSLILEFELGQISRLHSSPEYLQKQNEICKCKGIIDLRLSHLLSHGRAEGGINIYKNFALQNSLVVLTFKIICLIHGKNEETSHRSSQDNFTNGELKDSIFQALLSTDFESYPSYMRALMSLIAFLSSRDLKEKDRSFLRCMAQFSLEKATYNDKLINSILLEEYSKQLHANGDNDKAALIDTKLKYLEESIDTKLDIARRSLLEYLHHS